MSVIKTPDDGWDCVPELKEIVEMYENAGHHIYEIKNCVREERLDDMLIELENMCIDIQRTIHSIDENQEFETVEDED